MSAIPQAAPSEGRLAELEAIVARGLQTFLEVGAALCEIRDGKLYAATHRTFELYCRERWQFTATRARQLIDAADIAAQVSTATGVAIPTERHARALAPIVRHDGPEAAGKLLAELGTGATAVAVRAAVAEVTRPARQPKSPLALWRPEKPVPGPDALARQQAKVARGDDANGWADRDDPEAIASGDPCIAAIDALAKFLGEEFERVPLTHERVVMGRVWEALGHLQYQVAIVRWKAGGGEYPIATTRPGDK